MSVDYDPYSDEAMRDPSALYRRMREAGCPHYMDKYKAWALVRYDPLYDVPQFGWVSTAYLISAE